MRAFLYLTIIVLGFSGCAQRLDDFDGRMAALDKRTRILENSAGMPVGSDRQLLEGQKLADVRSQIAAIGNDVTVMKGDLETLRHETKLLRDKVNRTTANVDQSLQEAKQRSYVRSKTSSGGVQEDYDIALRALQDGKYREARQLFNAFLIKFPDHSLSDNALYWMGESYIAEKAYKKAISKYQDLIEKFPKSDKRCDAMGRQITAFEAIGMKKEASAFSKVKNAECAN